MMTRTTRRRRSKSAWLASSLPLCFWGLDGTFEEDLQNCIAHTGFGFRFVFPSLLDVCIPTYPTRHHIHLTLFITAQYVPTRYHISNTAGFSQSSPSEARYQIIIVRFKIKSKFMPGHLAARRARESLGSSLYLCFAVACRFFTRRRHRSHMFPLVPAGMVRRQD